MEATTVIPALRRTQHRLRLPDGLPALELVRFAYRDALSQPFQLDLDLECPHGEPDLESFLERPIAIDLTHGGASHTFHGLVHDVLHLGREGGTTHLRIHLRPWLAFLAHQRDCRIFQEKSVPEIVAEVFGSRGYRDFENALTGTYAKRTYCVQYRESDLDFVTRLLAEEGIAYAYRHEDDRHVLVLTDANDAHEAIGTFPYYPPENEDRRGREHVSSWTCAHTVATRRHTLGSYAFETPRRTLSASLPTQGTHLEGSEAYDYREVYVDEDGGDQRVRRWMERTESERIEHEGHANVRALHAGTRFTLAEHPQEDLNREYLVTRTAFAYEAQAATSQSRAAHAEEHLISFCCIPVDRTFRPQSHVRKPLIHGVHTAFVTGPAGEEIWTDRHGRVRVQFHWDRLGRRDESSSCWLRVAQGWAGSGHGVLFTPRIGQEVVVSFQDGDPDRPFVTGTLWNGGAPPIETLPASDTVSAIRTQSSPGGDGHHELRFEDRAGREQLYLHAQRRFDVRVAGSQFVSTSGERHVCVGSEDAPADAFESVSGEANRHVRDEAFALHEQHRHEVTRLDHLEKVDGSRRTWIGDVMQTTAREIQVESSGTESHLVDTMLIEGTTAIHQKGREIVLEADSTITFKVGSSFITLTADAVQIQGPQVLINSGGSTTCAQPAIATEAFEVELANDAASAQRGTERESTSRGGSREHARETAEPHRPPRRTTACDEASRPGRATGMLGAIVVDDAGTPLPGVRVSVPELGREGTTDWEGRVSFGEVPAPADHTVTAQDEGCAPDTVSVQVHVDAGTSETAHVEMRAILREETEHVTAHGWGQDFQWVGSREEAEREARERAVQRARERLEDAITQRQEDIRQRNPGFEVTFLEIERTVHEPTGEWRPEDATLETSGGLSPGPAVPMYIEPYVADCDAEASIRYRVQRGTTSPGQTVPAR